MPVLDPDLVRGLGVGQAAYVHQGGVTYVQVKRLVAARAALPRAVARRAEGPAPPRPGGAGTVPADAVGQRRAQPMADVSAFLDQAFGRERS